MRLRTVTVPAAAMALALVAPAAPAFAHGQEGVDKVVMKDVVEPLTEGGTAKNMEFVANRQYVEGAEGSRSQAGSDIEFGRIGGRDYTFAGTLRNGMQIFDITDPTDPDRVAVYDCAISQGDVQVFQQGERVLATYTADGSFGNAGAASTCGTDLGVTADDAGTVIVDVTDPSNPTTVGFAPVERGSHNMTVHPSGRYLYNSNSDLITSTNPTIVIFDIADPANPVEVQKYEIPFVPTSLGSESHDITFSEDGTRAYSAALSQTLILDTSDPENPDLISQIVDPTVEVTHGADPIKLKKSDGTDRELLLISDEHAGAATGTHCPGGGVHIYDITDETNPQKMGLWYIGESKPSTATCTAHVFRMHGDQGLFTIAWYDQGVRVVDVAGLADEPIPAVPFVVSGNGHGIEEIGRYTFDDHNTWSFKTNAIATDGSFFGFGNDLGRGLDVYRFTGLDREVPALVPTDLHPAAAEDGAEDGEAAPTGPGKSDGKGKGNGPKDKDKGDKDKGPKDKDNDAAFGLVPAGSGSGPAAGAMLALATLTAVVGGLAVARRGSRIGGLPA